VAAAEQAAHPMSGPRRRPFEVAVCRERVIVARDDAFDESHASHHAGPEESMGPCPVLAFYPSTRDVVRGSLRLCSLDPDT